MEYVKRVLGIFVAFIASVFTINYIRAKQQESTPLVPVACFDRQIAEKLKTDQALKWIAQIRYDTSEKDGTPKHYRCYFSFPKDSIACVPVEDAKRKNIHTCPNFPSVTNPNHYCYVIVDKYEKLANTLATKPNLSYKTFDGKVATSIPEAKKILSGKP